MGVVVSRFIAKEGVNVITIIITRDNVITIVIQRLPKVIQRDDNRLMM